MQSKREMSRTSTGERCERRVLLDETELKTTESGRDGKDLLLVSLAEQREECKSRVGHSEEVGLDVLEEVGGGAEKGVS